VSQHRVLSLKPQFRLEWRGQDGRKKPNQRDHRTNLADSSLNKPGWGFRYILRVPPKLSCLSSFGSLRASFPKLYQRRIMRPNDAAAQISTNVRFAPDAAIRLSELIERGAPS